MADSLSLQEVHNLIDKLESVRPMILNWTAPEIDLWDVPEVIDVVENLLDYDYAYNSDLPSQLGIPASTFRKLTVRGSKRFIRRESLVIVVERLRTFLKTLESSTTIRSLETAPVSELTPEKREPASTDIKKIHRVESEHWVQLHRDSDNQEKISSVALILESIVLQVSHSNVPAEEQLLSDIEKAQLVAILETALALLQAPMVEVGLLRNLSNRLKQLGQKSAEKKVQEGLERLADEGSERLIDLVSKLVSGG